MTQRRVKDEQYGKLCRRADELIRRVSEGTLSYDETMVELQELIEGKRNNNSFPVIDCDADHFIPEGWKVESHLKNGKIVFHSKSIELYLSGEQKNGFIKGTNLRNKLQSFKGESLVNANVLDFLIKPENWKYIPENWKDKRIYFWGTIYRRYCGRLYVRYLYWSDTNDSWFSYYNWLENDWWDAYGSAAVLVCAV